MKTIYTVIFAITILLSGVLQAQSLQILTLDDVDVSGTEQTYTGAVTDDFNTVEAHFKIKNTSGADIEVVVKKEYISIVEGTYNDFCWAGTCLTGPIMESSNMTVAAGAEQEDFDLHYHCQGIEGTTTIRYTAFDQANPTDSVDFLVNYVVGVNAIENLNGDVLISNVYPNPAKNTAKLDFNLQVNQKLQCDVYDMLGKLVYSESANGQGAIDIPVRKLPTGTYFCRLILDGELVETQKLMIQ
ncbi:MAG: T9SS type A sorting domain-containing protein [Bacteroidales bacterium]|jgi:hypothetical protein|nr:T9SS type A sorting domain-containing protein [Bacteroidales bacterium]